MTEERRLRRRVSLSVYLAAADATNGDDLGKVVDINAAGFLLLTNKNFVVGNEYSVNVNLPEVIMEKSVINCIAVACRISSCANEQFNEVGFDISYASIETKAIIEVVQSTWKLNFSSK